MEKRQQYIVEKWLTDTNPGTPLQDIVNSKSAINSTPTGKWYVRKSKYKIVNWWRKLTNTEKKEQEYTYTWNTYPYNHPENQ